MIGALARGAAPRAENPQQALIGANLSMLMSGAGAGGAAGGRSAFVGAGAAGGLGGLGGPGGLAGALGADDLDRLLGALMSR